MYVFTVFVLFYDYVLFCAFSCSLGYEEDADRYLESIRPSGCGMISDLELFGE